MNKTYFKIYCQGEHFKARLFPNGLRSIVSEDLYDEIMSFSNVEGTYRFSYGKYSIVLKVFPIKQKDN